MNAMTRSEEKPASGGPAASALKGYVALAVFVAVFSGVFRYGPECLEVFDFMGLLGRYGETFAALGFKDPAASGIRAGFCFAIALFPGVMLAMGILSLAEHFGAFAAAERLLSPVLKPLLGLPGVSGLALVSSLQSSDAGAAMTRELVEQGRLSERQAAVFAAFQFSSGGTVGVVMSAIPVLVAGLVLPVAAVLAVILAVKLAGANVLRVWTAFSRRP